MEIVIVIVIGINVAVINNLIGDLVLGARLESGRSRYEPGSRWVLSGSSHTSDLNTGIPVAPLPGAWCYRVSPGTRRPGVSIL